MDIHILAALWLVAAWAGIFVFYIDPGAFVPLISVLSAILGILLIFSRYVVMLVNKVSRKVLQILAKKPRPVGRELHWEPLRLA